MLHAAVLRIEQPHLRAGRPAGRRHEGEGARHFHVGGERVELLAVGGVHGDRSEELQLRSHRRLPHHPHRDRRRYLRVLLQEVCWLSGLFYLLFMIVTKLMR